MDVLYLDLAKAFDSVPHRKLMYKMEKIGIGGSLLKWLNTFICIRKSCVRVKNSMSPYEPVLSGIPQGSILGPILFILYIDNLTLIDLKSDMRLYADDAKIFKEINTVDDAIDLQRDLEKVPRFSRTGS